MAKHIFLVAGEESGDAHAADLVNEFRAKYPDTQFSGVGGIHMKHAGVDVICDLASYGVTGIVEVIKHFKFLYGSFRKTKKHLARTRPDILILVDSPGFNLPLAKYAKRRLGLNILYYISPQIWAWKPKRITTIKKTVDHMAVIFPFEKQIYEAAQVPVSFVGHPIIQRIDKALKKGPCQTLKARLPADKKIIALLPGSRNNEIQRHMPVLNDSISLLLEHNPQLHFIIPVANTVKVEQLKSHISEKNLGHITLCESMALDAIALSDFVIVASGTASLEASMMEKPMCIIYKTAFISYLVAAKLINIKYIGLTNILSNKMIVPELLQYDFNSKNLTEEVLHIINNREIAAKMHTKLQQLKYSLSTENADCSLMQLLENQLQLNCN